MFPWLHPSPQKTEYRMVLMRMCGLLVVVVMPMYHCKGEWEWVMIRIKMRLMFGMITSKYVHLHGWTNIRLSSTRIISTWWHIGFGQQLSRKTYNSYFSYYKLKKYLNNFFLKMARATDSQVSLGNLFHVSIKLYL